MDDAVDLRLQDLAQAIFRQIGDEAVVEMDGGMDHAPDRTVARAESLNEGADGHSIRDVKGPDDDGGAMLFHLADERGERFLDLSAPRHEGDVGRTHSGQPMRGRKAEPARPADDDIETRRGLEGLRRDIRARRMRRPDDDLSDMLGGLHAPEGGSHFVRLKHSVVSGRSSFRAKSSASATIISRARSGFAASNSSRSMPL